MDRTDGVAEATGEEETVMLSLKDVPLLVGLAGTVFSGGVAYHKVKMDIAEVSRDYRQHVQQQQKRDLYQERKELQRYLRENPHDTRAREDLDRNEMELKENLKMQIQLQEEKN